jgi:hypothetical protein
LTFYRLPDSLLGALERMVNRTGGIERVHSDNGPNFVKAKKTVFNMQYSKELRNDLGQIDWEEVKRSSEHLGIRQWSFSAPKCPEGNGAAEAMVKLAKTALKDTFKEVKLTFDEFRTALARAEGKVNSRPLGYVPADRWEAIEIVTPMHLMIGRAGTSFAPRVPSNAHISYVQHWEMSKGVARIFQSKWNKMCMYNLVSREKWTHMHENLEVGTVLLIKDDQAKRHDWKMAIVTSVKKDLAGVVRSVMVRLKSSPGRKPIELLRNVRQLTPLSV